MNKRRILLLAALFGGLSLTAQVKIGDNPQTIDPGSLLELESTDKALVITRVTDAQMNAINAQQGAVVYNTDGGCIYYFDGAAWINICESLGLQFTADAIVNSAPTIVITENGDIVNFEVGEIRSENILDFSIGSQDIQDNSINSDKLAPGSVGAEELQDNTVTDRVMDYSVVTLADFTNDAGYLVSGDIISDDDGNDLFPGTDSGVFYDDQFLQDAIDLNTTLLNAKENLSNKAVDPTLGGSNPSDQLYPTQNAVKTYVDNTVGGAAQTLTLTGNDLSISGGNSVDLSSIDDQNASEVEVAATPSNYFPANDNVEEHLAAIDVALSTAGAVTGEANGIFFADANPPNLGAPVTNVASLFWEQALRFGTGALGVGLENTTHANVGKVQISEQLPTGMAFPLHLNNAVGANGANVGILFGVSGSSPTAKGAIVYERNTAFGTNSGRGSFHILQNQSNASSTRPTLADAVVTVTADALVGIGTTTPDAANKLEIAGRTETEELSVNGVILDSFGNPGAATQVLSSTGVGTQWVPAGGGGGGSDNISFDLNLATRELELTDGAGLLAVNIDPLINTDDQTAAEVAANIGVTNYSVTDQNGNTAIDVEDHLAGIDAALGGGGTDNQNIQGSGLSGETLTIGIEDGTPQDVDLSSFALESELTAAIAASDAADGDTDPNNEIELPAGGNNGDVLATDGAGTYNWVSSTSTDDQNIQGSILTAETLTIGIEGGNPQDVDLSPFALDTDVAAAIAASEASDGDTDPNNEIELPAGGNNGDVLSTDGVGNYSWTSGSTIPTSTSGAIFFSDGAGGLSDSPSELFWDELNARLGIGNNSPDRALHVNGETKSTSFSSSAGTPGLPGYGFYTGDDFDTGMYRIGPNQLGFSTGGSSAMFIDASQQVGIGVPNALALFHVGGTARFDGTVTLSDGSTIPDYVFQSYFTGASELKPDYKMSSLDAVREYVEKNHHLPGVTSAAEVAEQGGIILNEATTQNLEKIEELFLHTIEQEAKIRSLKEENASLATELEDLKARMARIEILLSNQIEE